MAQLKDSHVYVRLKGDQNVYYPPVSFIKSSDRFYIRSTTEEYTHLIGHEVLTIDQVSIQKLYYEHLNYISSANSNYLDKKAFKSFLSGQKDMKRKVKLKDSKGNELVVELNNELRGSRYTPLTDRISKSAIGTPANCVAYLDMSLMSYNAFRNQIDVFKIAKSIVIDMRGYPTLADKNIKPFLGHFFKTTYSPKWIFTPKVLKPDRIDFFNNKTNHRRAPPIYKKQKK